MASWAAAGQEISVIFSLQNKINQGVFLMENIIVEYFNLAIYQQLSLFPATLNLGQWLEKKVCFGKENWIKWWQQKSCCCDLWCIQNISIRNLRNWWKVDNSLLIFEMFKFLFPSNPLYGSPNHQWSIIEKPFAHQTNISPTSKD